MRAFRLIQISKLNAFLKYIFGLKEIFGNLPEFLVFRLSFEIKQTAQFDYRIFIDLRFFKFEVDSAFKMVLYLRFCVCVCVCVCACVRVCV